MRKLYLTNWANMCIIIILTKIVLAQQAQQYIDSEIKLWMLCYTWAAKVANKNMHSAEFA